MTDSEAPVNAVGRSSILSSLIRNPFASVVGVEAISEQETLQDIQRDIGCFVTTATLSLMGDES